LPQLWSSVKTDSFCLVAISPKGIVWLFPWPTFYYGFYYGSMCLFSPLHPNPTRLRAARQSEVPFTFIYPRWTGHTRAALALDPALFTPSSGRKHSPGLLGSLGEATEPHSPSHSADHATSTGEFLACKFVSLKALLKWLL
jgi:hypothetical protein